MAENGGGEARNDATAEGKAVFQSGRLQYFLLGFLCDRSENKLMAIFIYGKLTDGVRYLPCEEMM